MTLETAQKRLSSTHCHWLTFGAAQRQGGHVRKGERATQVVYWKWRPHEELTQGTEQTGKENVSPCMPFVSAVFNLHQVEGVIPSWWTAAKVMIYVLAPVPPANNAGRM